MQSRKCKDYLAGGGGGGRRAVGGGLRICRPPAAVTEVAAATVAAGPARCTAAGAALGCVGGNRARVESGAGGCGDSHRLPGVCEGDCGASSGRRDGDDGNSLSRLPLSLPGCQRRGPPTARVMHRRRRCHCRCGRRRSRCREEGQAAQLRHRASAVRGRAAVRHQRPNLSKFHLTRRSRSSVRAAVHFDAAANRLSGPYSGSSESRLTLDDDRSSDVLLDELPLPVGSGAASPCRCFAACRGAAGSEPLEVECTERYDCESLLLGAAACAGTGGIPAKRVSGAVGSAGAAAVLSTLRPVGSLGLTPWR